MSEQLARLVVQNREHEDRHLRTAKQHDVELTRGRATETEYANSLTAVNQQLAAKEKELAAAVAKLAVRDVPTKVLPRLKPASSGIMRMYRRGLPRTGTPPTD